MSLGICNLGTVGHHTVTAVTTALDSGALYTQTDCTCERRGPFGGSERAGAKWAREHLAAIVVDEARA
jgi:hypothetical protein